ncbi:MAG: RNA polymerase sigma factor [Acidimicrobiales bacterium]
MTGYPAASAHSSSELLDLYDEALPHVYGYLLSRCHHVATAEELTSETWLAAAAALTDSLPGMSRPRPDISTAWLIGVARHKLIDHWRRLQREDRNLQAVASAEETGGNGGDDPWVEELDVLHAREILDQLPPNHRAVLVLRYVDDLPVADVARALGRSEHGTESLLARARSSFKAAYLAGEADDA